MPETILTLDDPTYFARLAAVEASHWWPRAMWRLASHWLDHALRGRRNLLALDVGCGCGGVVDRLKHRREFTDVVGLEPSQRALRIAAARGSGLIQADARRLPFRGATFDLVTCLDVWQHLPAGGDAFAAKELARVLKPGGLALIRVNHIGFARDRAAESAPYSWRLIKRSLDAASLRPLRFSPVNCVPALAQELRGRMPGAARAAHPGGGGLTIQTPARWINTVMGFVSTLEAAWAGRLGFRLPFGHSFLVLARRPASERQPVLT